MQASGDVYLTERLRIALTNAMRARDRTAMSALRSVLSAIGNAEAVAAPPDAAATSSAHVAGVANGGPGLVAVAVRA